MARILLADDDRGSLDLVRRALETDGHVVVTAEDGSEALAQLASAGAFDLLVADVQMPGIDGIELAKRARAQQARLPIVLMSGYAEVLEQARSIQGARLVTKPFTIEKIRAEARQALAG